MTQQYTSIWPPSPSYHPNLFLPLIWDYSCNWISLERLPFSQGALLKSKRFAEPGPWTLYLLELCTTLFQIAHQIFYSTNVTLSFKLLFHREDGESCKTWVRWNPACTWLAVEFKQKVDCIPSTCTVISELIQQTPATKERGLMKEHRKSSYKRISISSVLSKGLGLNKIHI